MPWNFFLVNINLHVAWQEDFLLERIVKRHHYFSVVGKRGSYGSTQLSRQNQKHHGKTKNLTAKTKTSRQNQKPHSKNKIPHGKTKNHTAKTKYLKAKPNTSQQKQNSFGFAVRYLVFAVKYFMLVLPWGL